MSAFLLLSWLLSCQVNEAEEERLRSEREHQRVTQLCQDAEARVQTLQKALKKVILKSKPYFELKAQFNHILEVCTIINVKISLVMNLPVSCKTLYQGRQEMLFQLLQKALCQSLRMHCMILHCKCPFSVKHKQIKDLLLLQQRVLSERGCRTYFIRRVSGSSPRVLAVKNQNCLKSR